MGATFHLPGGESAPHPAFKMAVKTESKPGWDMRRFLRSMAVQIARLLLTGVLFGFVYAWAAPSLYPRGMAAGFWRGSAHGLCMPLALPSLLMNQDVPIYAVENQGRSYKIGYIAGINVCGIVFFGLSFWTPRRRSKGE